MDVVLPHPAMLPDGPSIASPGCSRRCVTLSIGARYRSVTLGRCRSSIRGPAGRLGHPEPGAARACRGGSLQIPLSCSIGEPAFPSRPGAAGATARNEGEERSGAARSHAPRALQREHGEDGEHRTFPAVSAVAYSAPVGRSGHHRSTEKRDVTKSAPFKSGQVIGEIGTCAGVSPAASTPNTILCACSCRHSVNVKQVTARTS